MPRSNKSSMPSEGGAQEEGGDESGKSQNPDSSDAGQKKRPIGRKEAKKMLKNGGDAGPYKEAIEELILEKEEKKMREERWKETKEFHQQKITLEKEKLLWEQEQKIMFCDVGTLDPSQKAYVLAMGAQITAQKMAMFSSGFANGLDGGFGASSGGSEGDVN